MSPEPNSREDFVDRFWALQQEAKGYGFATLLAITNANDMFGEEDTHSISYSGGIMNALGLATYAQRTCLKELDP